MPQYEFRCRECSDSFAVSRPMSESGDPAVCPAGHEDTVRLLSTVSVGGHAAPPAPAGGGCCGGGCGCG